jgi:hypothetical protein
MKKFYMLTIACTLCCIAICHAQTRYWRGPANGNWNNTANWSADGISTGASVPNGTGFIAIFDQGSPLVNVDITPLNLLSLVVTNNTTAKLYTSSATNLLLNGTTTTNYALRIDAGSRLEDSVSADVAFNMELNTGARGLIDGTLYLGGHPSVTVASNGPSLKLPFTTSPAYRMDVNGTIIIGNKGWINTATSSTNFLFFNAGSEYQIARDGSYSPRATWAAGSTIRVTGTVNTAPVIDGPAVLNIGNLVFNCPAMANEIGWSLPTNMSIQGNFQVLNTNNQNLVLANSLSGATNTYTVNGNFQISGNSWVTLGNNNAGADRNVVLQVNGNYNQSGGKFDLRGAAITSATQPTELKIKGSFIQSAGTFGCASTATGTDLFVVELNGTSNQLIDLSSNTIDNAGNQVTLRMNNVNGATLAKPLSVGRINWSTNKGIITTTPANTFTINNTDLSSVAGAGTNAFVAGGPVARRTNLATAYSLPTGATGYRPCQVTPAGTGLSVYSAQYTASAYSNLTTAVPLYKVSNSEYWNIGRISGEDASVSFSLAAAVTGAADPDKVVIAHFNSVTSKWESAKGATGTEITPGNSSSGSASSEMMSSFSPFTFGVIPGSPLPVYLVSFNAKKLNNNSAKLDWVITTNSNPDRFEVLRSEDGISFRNIGTVKAVASQLAYSFVDAQLPAGKAYYQLRMIDEQGVPTISKIVQVFNNAEGWTINSMMPTLVTSQAKLNISASSRANIRLAVTDMFGRIVLQQQTALSAGSQDIWINLSSLPAGAYQITGYLDSGVKTGSFRFVKQ